MKNHRKPFIAIVIGLLLSICSYVFTIKSRTNYYLLMVKEKMYYKVIESYEDTSIGNKYLHKYHAVTHNNDSIQGVFLAHQETILGIWVESVNGTPTEFH